MELDLSHSIESTAVNKFGLTFDNKITHIWKYFSNEDC